MISILITLILVGVLLWFVQTYIPMAQPIKTLITVVVVIFVLLWLVQIFGIVDIPVPRFRR